MKLVNVQEIHSDPKGYNYGVSFINNKETSKYFSSYAKRLGGITAKQYDRIHKYWKIYKADLPFLLQVEDTAIAYEQYEPTPIQKEEQPEWMNMRPTPQVVPQAQERQQQQEIVHKPIYKSEDYANMGKDLKLQPYEYQKELIKFCVDHPEALLICPCGSGNIRLTYR